ncbi:MAG TPA: hypothetical protein VK864_18235, partial [Longimicrobiales bacterium]|nr:hypothetical protein [Longimicrobiales bacterium]
RSDRDHLELAGIGMGGEVGEYAMMAGQALRAWSQLMNQRDRAVEPEQAAVLWQEAMARLQAARFALEQLLDGRSQQVAGT